MGCLVEGAFYFLVNHLLVLFVLTPIGIVFPGYIIFLAISVFKELLKNKKG